jgi:hypothetical protein
MPTSKLTNARTKANPKPILRVLPQQPTAYANDTAITKKNKVSITLNFKLFFMSISALNDK